MARSIPRLARLVLGAATSAALVVGAVSVAAPASASAPADASPADRALASVARDVGVLDAAQTIAGLLAGRDAVNAERAEQRQAGETVYGTLRYSAAAFRTRVLAGLRNAAIDALVKSGDARLKVTDAQIAQEYDAHPARWSADASTYRTTRVSLPWSVGAASGATELATASAIPGAVTEHVDLAAADLAGSGLSPSAQNELATLKTGSSLAPQSVAGRWTLWHLDDVSVDRTAALATYRERIARSLEEQRFDALVARIADSLRPASAAVTGTPDRTSGAADAPSAFAGNDRHRGSGHDYFVDATRGSDRNSGRSPSSAWKSLDRVNRTTFSPGDRILLKAGETWRGQQLWPKGSGSTRQPITIDAYGDPRRGLPYISADGKVPAALNADGTKNPQTVGLSGAVVLRNQEHWTIRHLELSNDDDPSTDVTTQKVVRDGVSVSINADLFPAGANTVMRGITIEDLDVHDIDGTNSWQKIYLAGVNVQIFGAKQWTEYPAGGYHFEDVTIRDNSFRKVELNAIQFGFTWWGDAQGQTDESGRFHEGWEQLWIRTRDLNNRDVYIGHNYAEDIGQGVYQFAGTKNLLAEYNEGNGWLRRYSGVSAGLYLWAGADSTMRYNEIYGGPAAEFDATPWDLEYTNVGVTYEYNYSHDNQGGWMSYMGNSSDSVARYNLSVNDNGVIWKNMLSVNYSPTYVANNVFVYDGAKLTAFHDEVLKDRVYFLNNTFYNTSRSTPTTWAATPGGLARGVFSNNDVYEASGRHSADEPAGKGALRADPRFVSDPSRYRTGAGVGRILSSAALFTLRGDSPLIDAGRYNAHLGAADFFGTHLYYGTAPDIGIQEVRRGSRVAHPVDRDPIEKDGIDTRTDLALGKPVTVSSQHEGTGLEAANLTDGKGTTRWAAEDAPIYPVTLDVDFGAPTTFTEVHLGEYFDGGTNPRVKGFRLQRWDDATASWVTFSTHDDGIGFDRSISDVGAITTSKLRVSLDSLLPGETSGPTLTGIRVFASAA